jgi:hypothetical protein
MCAPFFAEADAVCRGAEKMLVAAKTKRGGRHLAM